MRSAQSASWLRWSEAFPPSEAVGGTVSLADRILRLATEADSPKTFVAGALSEIATEFAAQWAAVRQRTP